MIIITGSILAKAQSFEEIKAASLAHVARSRKEDGCISHTVAIDCDNPLRLIFLEMWRDEAAVKMHFANADARAFAKKARELAAEPTELWLYNAELRPLA